MQPEGQGFHFHPPELFFPQWLGNKQRQSFISQNPKAAHTPGSTNWHTCSACMVGHPTLNRGSTLGLQGSRPQPEHIIIRNCVAYGTCLSNTF